MVPLPEKGSEDQAPKAEAKAVPFPPLYPMGRLRRMLGQWKNQNGRDREKGTLTHWRGTEKVTSLSGHSLTTPH